MDRREWLTVIYREANLFIQKNPQLISDVTSENRDLFEGIKPALLLQLNEIMSGVENLEDLIKFSLLRDPDPDIWRNETTWTRVLISVAMECLMFDITGIIEKIIDGELPEMNPHEIVDFNPHQKIPVHDDTTQRVQQGMPGRDDHPDGDGVDDGL